MSAGTVTEAPDDRSKVPLTKTVIFRGIEYTIRELSMKEFDQINDRATEKVTVEDEDGGPSRTIERLNGSTQARLMIAACVTPKVNPAEIGTRLFGGLNRAVNDLHFAAEPDETPKPDAKTDTEGTSKGN